MDPSTARGIIAEHAATTTNAVAELTLDALVRLRDAVAGPPPTATPDLLGTLSNAELDALELEHPAG